MKIQTECIPCLIKRIIFEAEHSTSDKKIITKAIRDACRVLSELYDPNVCSVSIATQVHRAVYDALDDSDPYKNLKKESNRVALELIPKVEGFIKNFDDPLKASIICSIVGNMMDFGISGASDNPEMLRSVFSKTFEEGLGFDDVDKMKHVLQKSKNVLLFTDNCGEIVFDKILCREIKKCFPDVFLTLVVKGEATMDDALELDFDDVVDEILTTDCFAVGVDFNKVSNDLRNRLDDVDLIVCKGMANYEAFSETKYRPVVYLLRTKCLAIADSMGLALDKNIVKIYQ